MIDRFRRDLRCRVINPMAIDDYLHAVYSLTCEGQRYEFTFVRGSLPGAGHVDINLPRPWALVSACNPMSRRQNAKENERRDRELEALLRRDLIVHGPAEGRSPDGRWREASCVLIGVDRKHVLSIARRFGQRAMIWSAISGVGLLDCLSERLIIRPMHGRAMSE
jgi:hypothetical protein